MERSCDKISKWDARAGLRSVTIYSKMSKIKRSAPLRGTVGTKVVIVESAFSHFEKTAKVIFELFSGQF